MSMIRSAISSLRRMSDRLRTAIRETLSGADILEGLARVGHAAHGLVYLFVGVLATGAAVSDARPPSLGGASSLIEDVPGGPLLLLALAGGLCAYAGWRMMQALLDLQREGWDIRGLIRRMGTLGEAALYAGLGFMAAITSLGWSPAIRQELREELGEEGTLAVVWTARILDWPLGHWIIALIGVGVILMGFNQVIKARRTEFSDIAAGGRAMAMIRIIGTIGFAAKGAILAVTGLLLLVAAWRAEASAAGGMRAAMEALASVPLGDTVLLTVSAGLVLYGLFHLIKAWRHKPVTP